MFLSNRYPGDIRAAALSEIHEGPAADLDAGKIDAQQLASRYCAMLHEWFGTYEEVSRRTRLDRHTMKKHIERVHDMRGDEREKG